MGVLEELLSSTNENFFLKEFSFALGQFSPVPEKELEFADNVVWLRGLLMLFQAKERVGDGDHDRWFARKVLGHATKQIRDTIGYLEQYGEVELTNNRGHRFRLDRDAVTSRHNLVVYHAPDPTPLMSATRHHESRTAGTIHVFSMQDYRDMCTVMATPREIDEYLGFRANLLQAKSVELPGEKALVGQFLSGRLDAAPSEEFAQMVDRLQVRRSEWDMSQITEKFGDRVTFQMTTQPGQGSQATLYYDVLGEIAALSRTELTTFRERFDLALTAATKAQFKAPLRMISESGCGFLFVAVPPQEANRRLQGLENLTLGSKYEQRLERHVGVVMSPDGDELQIDWAYVSWPWRHDHEIEALLKKSNPFLPLKSTRVPRYRFDGEGEREEGVTASNKQLPASFAALTTTIMARVREPRRQL